MLSLKGVAAGYGGASRETDLILEHLSLEVPDGETLAVVGASGSGKTTLLRLLAGTLAPVAGTVSREASVWLSPQTPILIDFRTSLQNAMLGAEIAKDLTEADVARGRATLADLGLTGAEAKTPASLSGGMRRRVALAQAVLSGRQLVLLDEPFAELDGLARQRAEIVIDAGARARRITIIVTHDLDSVCALCSRALVLAGPPTKALAIIPIDSTLTQLEGPATRRESPMFASAVADLQRQILGVGRS